MASSTKKVLFLYENEEIEIELYEHLRTLSDNLVFEAISIKYWLFWPNLTHYDLIIMPFVPSSPSTHHELICAFLEAGGTVLAINWWQTDYECEFNYQLKSLKSFAGNRLYLCSWKNKFTKFLSDNSFGQNTYECKNPVGLILQTRFDDTKKKISNKIFLLIDFDMAFTSERLMKYRLKTGYKTEDLNKRITSTRKFAMTFIDELTSFCRHNPNVQISLSNYSSMGNSALIEFLEKIEGSLPENFLINKKSIVSEIINSSFTVTNDQSIHHSLLNSGGNSLLYDSSVNLGASIERYKNGPIPSKSIINPSHLFLSFIESIIVGGMSNMPFFSLSIRLKLMSYNIGQHIKKLFKTYLN